MAKGTKRVTWSEAKDLVERRIADIKLGQSFESYVAYIEGQLSGPDFTIEVLTAICRHYGVGIDQLPLHLANLRAHVKLEKLFRQIRLAERSSRE